MKLYELAEQYKNLESYLAEPDIIDEAKFKEQFAQITGEFNVKVENICKLILTKQAETKAIDEEISRLTNRNRINDNKINWLKNYVQVEMQNANVDKVDGQVLSASLQKNPVSCVIVDESLVPLIFKKIIPESYVIEKKLIVEEFKRSGEIQPGTQMITDKKSLRIR